MKVTLPLEVSVGDHVFLVPADMKKNTAHNGFSLYGKVISCAETHARVSMRNGTGCFRLNLHTGRAAPYGDTHRVAVVKPAAEAVDPDYNIEMDKVWSTHFRGK